MCILRAEAPPRARSSRAASTASSSATMTEARPAVPTIKPGVTRIGWVGTGVMGSAMAGHLQAAGYYLSVFNRTASKADALRQKGAQVLASPAEVARASDVVFTIVVDMTTSEPALAREIAAAAKSKGCHSVDAPVSGGDKGAKGATLAIMTGGDEHIVQALAPLFSCMGSATYLGPAGAGQSCKLANQVTIASTMVGMVEGMLYAHKAGLHSLDLYAPRLLQRDFLPGFYVKHFVKDLGIALQECRDLNLSLPGLALAQQLYVSLKAHGDEDLGTQALLLALERLNNTAIRSD
eukprot:jgi/Mesen1/3549/ME000199S02704